MDPGLTLLSGGSGTDTIGALMPALVVSVADAEGLPRGGVEIRITPEPGSGGEGRVHIFRTRLPQVPLTADGIIVDTTDAAGRIASIVRLGTRAGEGAVRIRAEGYADLLARFLIEPGQTTVARLEPSDSAVMVGGSYRLRRGFEDRAGNTVPGVSSTLWLLDGPVGLEAGDRMTGMALGRGRFVLEGEGLVDTAWVSVVPDGILAAHQRPRMPGELGSLVVFRTDGSGLRRLVERPVPALGPSSWGAWPAWSPSGAEIAFLQGEHLEIVDVATGATRRMILPGEEPVAAGFPPEFDASGEWIYFTRGFYGSQNTVWRVRRDGTDAIQVSPPVEWGLEQRGSPSPDGARLVYQTNRTDDSGDRVTIRVLDLGTGVTRDLATGGFPRWSPSGEWIAYGTVDGLRTIRPDGTGDRALGISGVDPGFGWSPDGRWMVVDTWPLLPRLDLVHLDTGLRLPLGFSQDMTMGAWHP